MRFTVRNILFLSYAIFIILLTLFIANCFILLGDQQKLSEWRATVEHIERLSLVDCKLISDFFFHDGVNPSFYQTGQSSI
jgi:hypothetical protein